MVKPGRGEAQQLTGNEGDLFGLLSSEQDHQAFTCVDSRLLIISHMPNQTREDSIFVVARIHKRYLNGQRFMQLKSHQ